jgi:hypothetical protein
MKRTFAAVAAALVLTAVPLASAHASWKLVDAGKPVAVAKSGLTVTAGQDWNRSSVRPIKASEVWTLDGVNLNQLYFVAGLVPGQTMYRDAAKKDRPLPTFRASAQLTDIPEFVESSTRIALNTSVFELTGVQPTKFAGRQGVRFTYQYAVEGSPLMRKGIGTGAIVDGKLHLIVYTAPALYYYDRDVAKVTALMDSARL